MQEGSAWWLDWTGALLVQLKIGVGGRQPPNHGFSIRILVAQASLFATRFVKCIGTLSKIDFIKSSPQRI
jgi:hypothetical protein